MTRREKLIERMRQTPGSVRFAEVDALLRHEGIRTLQCSGQPSSLPSS